MIKGIFMAGRSLHSGNQHIEVVANNIANINTSGFKKEAPFTQLLDEAGNLVIRQVTDYKQGELTHTGNPLDIAIKGEGFFTVETENGEMLTRDGRFTVSQEGFLVNVNGDKVLGKDGEISFSANIFDNESTITVTKNGEILAGKNIIDELKIVKPEDLKSLEKAGNNYFTSLNGDYMEVEEGEFELSQGYLESSNVNPVEEMENMIRLNTDYQSSYKIMNQLDESLKNANQIGRV
ncbi:MAG: flagellar hook-basal body protein [Melioribacteraceae bacterium]|nr:flagellar hook-basal body protein [Melioribacteraceae bacterium]